METPALMSSTPSRIRCCMCGTLIESNPANMCVGCIRSKIDIAEGIPKQLSINYCRNCGRYLQPPNAWVAADLESKELLTFCIKRIKGLSKVKLVDASFVWTEAHSRRIKLKLTIQKEVFAATILQQSFIVEFVVHTRQCDACTKLQTNQSHWVACVQLRQKVEHKKTFFFLEQLILKHNAHANSTGIKQMPDGIDFFYDHKSHALKLIDFLGSVVPIKWKTAEQLVSQDDHSNTYNYKFTFSTEIAPICRDDWVCLPPKLASSLGNSSPFLMCTKISNLIHLIDPITLKTFDISASTYWKYPFRAIMSTKQLIPFIVLDANEAGQSRGKYLLSDLEVAKESDFGSNDITYQVRSHLGHLLKAGDCALGYDLRNAVFNDADAEITKSQRKYSMPDILIVKKSYQNQRKRSRARRWKLRDLPKEKDDSAPKRRNEEERDREEYESFLQDIEEDPEYRSQINLYKAEKEEDMNDGEEQQEDSQDEDGEDGEFPDVKLEELLEDMKLDDDAETDAAANEIRDRHGFDQEDEDEESIPRSKKETRKKIPEPKKRNRDDDDGDIDMSSGTAKTKKNKAAESNKTKGKTSKTNRFDALQ